jgi:hemolysin activation/secretion protein
LSGALELDDLDIFQNGAISREDRLRTLKIGLQTTRRNSTRRGQWNVDLEKGLDIFGSKLENFSNPDDSRARDFTIARLHYLTITKLNDNWSIRSDAYAQYSAQVLPSIKRFKLGGNRIGRGFEAAAVSGDRGVGTKFELKRLFQQQSSWFRVGGVYGFYDLGGVWKNDSSGRESAASAGIGLSLNGELLTGYLEMAVPLTHADADGNKDAGIFVELSFRF